jgi:Ankyrin repeats (many copies)
VIYAFRNGALECLKLLLEHQANLNIKNYSGWTPIHFIPGCEADTNIRDRENKTAMDIMIILIEFKCKGLSIKSARK